MKLLVLGGTGFLGYHVLAEAVKAGHEVSAFTREGDAPLPEVEPLPGDRQGDLSALHGREWDAVFDTFSDPDAVSDTARLLSGSVGTYGFVSGISNYHPDGPDVVDENSSLRRPREASEDDPLQERSIAKLRCEQAVQSGFEGPAFIIRPGIMVGPRDPTDRFTWWPLRFGGKDVEVLAPGDPERPVQFTDVRDLSLWAVRMLDAGEGGTFNGVGPGYEVSLREVLEACRRAANTGTEFQITWAGEDFLREQLSEVTDEERPLWFPEDQIPFQVADSSKALESGLNFRPVEETARDTLAWTRSNPREGGFRAGFDPEFERKLLQRWHKR